MIIETKGLTKVYDKITAVDNLNLKIKEGEVFGLLGPNGAGKTTTLLMLTTIRTPTKGKAIVNGYDVAKEPDKVRSSIGIVFQEPSSDDLLTGRENLYLHGMLYGMDIKLIKERMEEVLELVGLTDRANDIVKHYSGGMRRRLEIARGLMHRPKVLFLDEPTLGLDPQSREHIWKYIEKMVEEEKITIVITTHYMEEADRLCNRIAIIDNGKIVVLNSPGKLKKVVGGDIVELKVKNYHSDVLNKLSYVKTVNKSNGKLTLTVLDASKHLPEILRKAGNVESVNLRSATLEDVFMHYTGREIREEEGEGGWAERIAKFRGGSNE